RKVPLIKNTWSWLSGFGGLAAVYPWCLGTFRTLDLGKFVGQHALGFHLFCGSAAFLMAAFGGSRPAAESMQRPKRTALILIGLYWLILFTPLLNIFYQRCSTLPVMGFIVLAALGAESLLNRGEKFI